jgi:hypothetical protein
LTSVADSWHNTREAGKTIEQLLREGEQGLSEYLNGTLIFSTSGMLFQTVFEVFFVSKYYSLALSLESLVLQQPVNPKFSAQCIVVVTVIL